MCHGNLYVCLVAPSLNIEMQGLLTFKIWEGCDKQAVNIMQRITASWVFLIQQSREKGSVHALSWSSLLCVFFQIKKAAPEMNNL